MADEITGTVLMIAFFFYAVSVLGSLLIYQKARKLFSLSYYKGIKYFSKAFLYFAIALSLDFLSFILLKSPFHDISLIAIVLGFATVYTVSVGGFYLCYSLVWRYIESGIFRSSTRNVALLHVVSLIIASIETLFQITNQSKNSYLVFTVQLITLLFALISNYTHERRSYRSLLEPHFFSVILGFLIFLILFLSHLLRSLYEIAPLFGLGFLAMMYLVLFFRVRKICTEK